MGTLPVTANQTFEGQIIQIDGIRFENCKFVNCRIIYRGAFVQFDSCEFAGETLWKFEGPAGTVMHVLGAAGWIFQFGPPGPLSVPLKFPEL